MDYIRELRKKVGTWPIIGVGVTVMVFNQQGQVLLQLRSDTKTWGLPGGHIEPGEGPKDTAARELYEETGLAALDFILVEVLAGPEFFFVYPNGDQVHSVIILYRAISPTGELQGQDSEGLRLGWFALDDLPILESRAQELFRQGLIKP